MGISFHLSLFCEFITGCRQYEDSLVLTDSSPQELKTPELQDVLTLLGLIFTGEMTRSEKKLIGLGRV